MKTDIVSRRYASAFYEFLKESGKLAEVLNQMSQLVSITKSDKDVNTFIMSPLINKDEKTKFANSLRNKSLISSEFYNFLNLLIQKSRLPLLSGIYDYMKYLEMEDRGEVYAEVAVAGEIDDDTKSSIKKALESISGKKISLEIRKDPSIIAGFVAKIKSNQLDASVKGQLAKLKDNLVL